MSKSVKLGAIEKVLLLHKSNHYISLTTIITSRGKIDFIMCDITHIIETLIIFFERCLLCLLQYSMSQIIY